MQPGNVWVETQPSFSTLQFVLGLIPLCPLTQLNIKAYLCYLQYMSLLLTSPLFFDAGNASPSC